MKFLIFFIQIKVFRGGVLLGSFFGLVFFWFVLFFNEMWTVGNISVGQQKFLWELG